MNIHFAIQGENMNESRQNQDDRPDALGHAEMLIAGVILGGLMLVFGIMLARSVSRPDFDVRAGRPSKESFSEDRPRGSDTENRFPTDWQISAEPNSVPPSHGRADRLDAKADMFLVQPAAMKKIPAADDDNPGRRIDAMLQMIERLKTELENLKKEHENAERQEEIRRVLTLAMAKGRLELKIGPREHPSRIVLAYVPPGIFEMGRTDDERRLANLQSGGMHHDWSVPQHKVRVETGYFIGVHEITAADFSFFRPSRADKATGTDPTRPDREMPVTTEESAEQRPVSGVTCNDAMAFCRWLEAGTGVPVRLPTEVEWEYAARGPASLPFARLDGSDFNNRDHSSAPSPVGGSPKDTSWCGAMDMSGNVQEWCQDVWDPEAYQKVVAKLAADESPHRVYDASAGAAAVEGELRVVRGGNFRDPPANCEAATRRYKPGDNGHETVGFRIVVPLPMELLGMQTPIVKDGS